MTRWSGSGPLLLDRHRRHSVQCHLVRRSLRSRQCRPTTSPLQSSVYLTSPQPFPVPVLKSVADLLVPFVTYLFNQSLTSGSVPAGFKDSFITPVIKRPGLDEGSPSSYRPISNLSVISKLFERLVARQLVTYLDTHRLLPATQSGFRRGHSTETDTIRVLSDLLDSVDRGDTAVLVLLDLTAAFDTVNHEILLKRLQVTFGVDNTSLSWFSSYLAGRKQHVRCGGKSSSVTDVVYGVPQGSVLGPILFIIYTADLAPITLHYITLKILVCVLQRNVQPLITLSD